MPSHHQRSLAVRAAAAALLVAGLAACGADTPAGSSGTNPATADSTATAGQPSGRPTPPPTPAGPLTADDLAAAMPTATDLPDGFSITSSCPGELCSAESELPNASVLAESDAEDAADFVAVGATEYPDAEAAAASLASSRSTREAETGPFETPVQDREDGYTPGRTGEGTLEDAAVDDWTGYRHIATYQTIHPDTGMSDEVRTEGHLVLARGTTMISVQLLNEGSDVAGVEAQLDERIRSLIAALP